MNRPETIRIKLTDQALVEDLMRLRIEREKLKATPAPSRGRGPGTEAVVVKGFREEVLCPDPRVDWY